MAWDIIPNEHPMEFVKLPWLKNKALSLQCGAFSSSRADFCVRAHAPQSNASPNIFSTSAHLSEHLRQTLSRTTGLHSLGEKKTRCRCSVGRFFSKASSGSLMRNSNFFFRCYIGNGSRQLWKSILTDTDGCKWLPCRLPFDFQKFPLGTPHQKYSKFSVISVISVISVHSRRR